MTEKLPVAMTRTRVQMTVVMPWKAVSMSPILISVKTETPALWGTNVRQEAASRGSYRLIAMIKTCVRLICVLL